MTTIEDVVRLLERGTCAHEKRADCATCAKVAEAVAFVRGLPGACAYAAARRVIDGGLDAEEAAVRGIADVVCGEWPRHELPESLRGAS